MTVFMQEIDVWDRAWSFGLSEDLIRFLSTQDHGLPKELIDQHIVSAMHSMARRRTRSQMKRLVLRNRRSYNHDLALRLRHERQVLWERDGMRCHSCRYIPPQPGEIMEEME